VLRIACHSYETLCMAIHVFFIYHNVIVDLWQDQLCVVTWALSIFSCFQVSKWLEELSVEYEHMKNHNTWGLEWRWHTLGCSSGHPRQRLTGSKGWWRVFKCTIEWSNTCHKVDKNVDFKV
jgi:hypothetical protein